MNYKKQAFYNTLGNVVYLACMWLMTVVVVRLSGFEDAGILNIAMSVGNVFFFIGMYGIRSFQSSDTTHKYSDKTYIKTRVITVLGGFVACVIYLLLGAILGFGYNFYTSFAVLLYLLYRSFEAGSDVLFGELQKDEHLDVCGISMSAKGILSVAVFYVLLKFFNLNTALFGMTILAAAIMIFYDYNRYKKFHIKVETNSPGTVKQLLLEGIPMLLTTIFPIIVTAVPRLALESYNGAEILGIYSSVCTPTIIITTLVPNILCPFMTLYGKLYNEGQNGKLVKLFIVSIILTLLLGVAACACAWLLGDWALSLLYGDEILSYTYIFVPIIIATVVYAFSMCGNSVLISIRALRPLTIFAAAALLVCLIISYPLTKAYGMWGTVFAFGLPFAVQFVLQIIYIFYALYFSKRKNEVL